jgi:hypothetical protein
MALVAMTERGDQIGEARAANVEFDLHVTKPVELEDVEALLACPAREPAADPLEAAAAPDRLAGRA